MKILIILFSLTSSLALSYEGFRCVPSARSTRFQVLVQEAQIEILVTNPTGYSFMPQFDSGGTLFNISFNKMQAKDLEELSEQFAFTWPKDLCKVDSENFKVSCNGIATNLVKSIKAFGITTTEMTEKYEEDIYIKRKFRFSLEKDNMYFVSQEYDIKFCQKFTK
ncbi:MAG: hypothetical protein H7061_09365 [Bdellovibrionaceae bacterium]|nr:hypothetical protein [Bdellovibrio sp.]